MDPYRQELNRLVEGKEKLRQAIIGKGVEVPVSAKIQEYPEYIRKIKEKPPVPTGPATTLAILKMQMDAGIAQAETPIGTEIADVWDNREASLIVGTYRQVTTASGATAFAVGLVRKYSTPVIGQLSRYGYPNSAEQTYINGTYFEKCSAEVKEVIADVNVPVIDSSTSSTTLIPAKFFPFSRSELNKISSLDEGAPWEYWKNRANLVYKAVANGGPMNWSLRSGRNVSGYSYYVDQTGNVNSAGGGMIGGGNTMPTVAHVVGCYIIKEEK